MEITSGKLYRSLPTQSLEEVMTHLAQGRSFHLERIVSTGQTTPPGQWYDQPQAEWVALLSGSANLQIAGEALPRALLPGDWILLPAHLRHRVESTSLTEPTVWLALHFESG